MTAEQLILAAKSARKKAYAPYSHFAVGAALLTRDGVVLEGCNVENASYSATYCAERTAFLSAIAKGYREFDRIAIVGGKEGEETSLACMPCGVCRQFMSEFVDQDFEIVIEDRGAAVTYTLDALLPHSFSQKNLTNHTEL